MTPINGFRPIGQVERKRTVLSVQLGWGVGSSSHEKGGFVITFGGWLTPEREALLEGNSGKT